MQQPWLMPDSDRGTRSSNTKMLNSKISAERPQKKNDAGMRASKNIHGQRNFITAEQAYKAVVFTDEGFSRLHYPKHVHEEAAVRHERQGAEDNYHDVVAEPAGRGVVVV